MAKHQGGISYSQEKNSSTTTQFSISSPMLHLLELALMVFREVASEHFTIRKVSHSLSASNLKRELIASDQLA
jgi:hypothetical protein